MPHWRLSIAIVAYDSLNVVKEPDLDKWNKYAYGVLYPLNKLGNESIS
jgi:hypothetical protein